MLDSISSFFCILTYAVIYVLIHHIIFGFIFTSKIFFFFSSTPVLASFKDVIFVLSIKKSVDHRCRTWCNIVTLIDGLCGGVTLFWKWN